MSSDLDSRVERELAELSSDDATNALPCLLYEWLQDKTWIEAAVKIPSTERRAWLAAAGARAFDGDAGGYASFLRTTTASIDYIWTADELERILRRHTQDLLVNLSDMLDFRFGRLDAMLDQVTVSGAEHFQEVLATGRGVMALAVHQSHPAFGFFHSAWNHMAISAVANLGDRKATHSSMLLDGLRERVELLPTTAAALRPMLARLATGGCVAIYADYLYPGTPGTVSALFGGPVMISSAAVSVALRTGAAVIPVSVARVSPPDSGGVQVQIGTALPLYDLDPRDPESREAAALRFGIAMECLIRRHPSVWRLWATLLHRWHSAEMALAPLRQQT
jgi:lauroyl/myristoyl acyltransferase